MTSSLEKLTTKSKLLDQPNLYHQQGDLKRFYEQLSDAQNQVASFKEDWEGFEGGVTSLMSCLKSHSEFDVIDGN